MKRFFNTAGPIKTDKHYHIEPIRRLNFQGIQSLIDQEKYFVLHAPRQTGKTSLLISLMDHLNKQGRYKCLYVNVENAQAARENVEKGIRSILESLGEQANDFLEDSYVKEIWRTNLEESGEYNALNTVLKLWSKNSKRPIVLLMDEIDSLVGDTLISVLRQLRSGYPNRPGLFPQSIILCGVRDVRDYRIHSDKEKAIITGGSAFNIKAESLRLGNFNPSECKELYLQHTKETGQRFHDDVFPLVWELTEGQPWLVNALAYETCFNMQEGKDRKRIIDTQLILRAKENLIMRRQTHLDQLADKLGEERVRRVIEPLLAGTTGPETIPPDDIDYVVDLGLVVKDKHLRVANRIYSEIIPRQLTYSDQLTISQETEWYLKTDGSLDMNKLLTAFQEFFREHFESWIQGFAYAEAGPQLLLQAFLQRIINGGGRVEREYGFGRERIDLYVIWPCKKGTQKIVIELKIRYGSLETTISKGLKQTAGFMDKCGAKEGYLLIFDRTPGLLWETKIFKRDGDFNGTKITVYGM